MTDPSALIHPGPWHIPEIALAAIVGLICALWLGWL